MPAAVELREDFSAVELRRLATRSRDANRARRLLALAGVRDGMSREAAALIGGMDRQTLRDWVHAFNARGPDGLVNAKAPGAQPKLSPEQQAEIAALCPPEDCGGPHGYAEFLRLLLTPEPDEIEQQREMTVWSGGRFHPGKFDLAKTDKAVRGAHRRRRAR